MEIKYTYKEPEDRPIERAEFLSSLGSPCAIEISDDQVELAFPMHNGEIGEIRIFHKADFAALCKLLNRINRQVNGVSE